MNKTFDDSEQKVFSFMEAVQEELDIQKAEEEFLQSDNYKYQTLEKNKEIAKNVCLDTIFSKLYKDAIPLNDDYKCANREDLDNAFKDFIYTRCPQGIEYYVKEGLRKHSPFAKKVLEAVNNLVNDHYHDKEMNIENIPSEELVFRSNDDFQKKIDIIGQNLSVPEISQVVKDNVKNTAISEITRAKKEKEKLKNIESDLAKDIDVNTQEKVEEALSIRDVNQTKDYEPTLFEGIMVNKLNKMNNNFSLYRESYENINTYNVLEEYGFSKPVTQSGEIIFTTPEELAFIESVKEYTALSLVKALRLESFNKQKVDQLAQEYAYTN